jgi:di/tricarboxylate transporter
VGLFVWNRLSVGIVAIGVSLALIATGVLDVETGLAGFGDPVVIFIATLFVVSEGIDSSGITTWAGQALLERSGDSPRRIVVGVLALAAVLAAIVTMTGATAALIPLVVLIAARKGTLPSQTLMPLAFASSAGSLLTLTGSPVNVIVSDAAAQAGAGSFGFFAFAAVGLPIVLVTITLCVWLAPKLVPVRTSQSQPPDLSGYAHDVAGRYDLRTEFARARLREGSPLVGTRVEDLRLEGFPSVTLVGVQAGNDRPETGRYELQPEDVVVLSGPQDEIDRVADELGLAVSLRRVNVPSDLLTKQKGVVEVVVPPRSNLVGETFFPGLVRGDLVVMSVGRLGKDRGPRTTQLAQGDTLLLRGPWQAVDLLAENREVLLVDAPDLIRRQAAPLGRAAFRAMGVVAVMVVLLLAGVAPAVAGLVAAGGMVLLGVVGVEQAYRSVSWQSLVLIGGMIPLSSALTESGLADTFASGLVEIVGDAGPMMLLLVLFAFTASLGQVISNTATVLVVAPIAVAAAAELAVSVRPVLMVVAVAGSAALLTPIATPANTMVMGAAGFRFGDFWKLGLPLMISWLVVALVVVPVVWPL